MLGFSQGPVRSLSLTGLSIPPQIIHFIDRR